MTKRFIKSFLLIIGSLFFFAGCSDDGKETAKVAEEAPEAEIHSIAAADLNSINVYMVNKDKTSVVTVPIDISNASSEEEAIQMVMDALINEPKDKSLTRTIPDYVTLSDIIHGKQTDVYFDSGYYKMTPAEEILLRTAIVKTLTQFEEIEFVEFYINDQKLMIDGKLVGRMQFSDFVDDSMSASTQTLKLYFGDVDGKYLVEEVRAIELSPNATLEQLVVEQLIAGPGNNTLQPTLPEDTKVIKVVVKEGICYLDLNEAFTDKGLNVSEEVTIYSVVNSLVELQTVNKVQFLINGEKKPILREKLSLDTLFERNLDLVVQ